MCSLAGHSDLHRGTYLWVLQASEVRVQVELDACGSTRQRHTTNQQHDEHDKWERGCDVDHLKGITIQKSKVTHSGNTAGRIILQGKSVFEA